MNKRTLNDFLKAEPSEPMGATAIDPLSGVIIFFGANGSGKSTVAKKLANEINRPYLGTGDLMRTEVAKQTALGERIKTYLDKNIFVPDDITTELTLHYLQPHSIVDGFPRTFPQVIAIDKQVSVSALLHFIVSEDIARDRQLARNRADDTVAGIASRLAEYERNAPTILSFYRPKRIIHRIDGDASQQETYAAVRSALGLDLPKTK